MKKYLLIILVFILLGCSSMHSQITLNTEEKVAYRLIMDQLNENAITKDVFLSSTFIALFIGKENTPEADWSGGYLISGSHCYLFFQDYNYLDDSKNNNLTTCEEVKKAMETIGESPIDLDTSNLYEIDHNNIINYYYENN